jgi:hypothetical protein
MSKTNVPADALRDQAKASLERLSCFIEAIEARFERDKLIGSAADYIRLLQYRMELVERLGLNQPPRVEVRWVAADWEVDQSGKPAARESKPTRSSKRR